MISILFLILSLNLFLPNNKTNEVGGYFPKPLNNILIYQTNFGETECKYVEIDNLIISKNQSDRFKYFQKLIVNETGIYALETYQFINFFFS